MIYLKLILAVILSTVPLLIHFFTVLCKNDETLTRLSTVFSTIPFFLKKCAKKILGWFFDYFWFIRFFDSYRLFFTRVFMLIFCVYGCVDYSASEDAKVLVEDYVQHDANECAIQFVDANAYIPGFLMITSFVASIVIFIFVICMWVHPWADRLLLFINSSRMLFCGFAVLAIIVVAIPHTFIIGEVLFILLIASYLYPEKILDNPPIGREPIPQDPTLIKAA